jgi:nucleoside-diphosphate-sugar epimerase
LTRTIGISCIGSGVGQSVIRSLNLSRLPIRTVGFGSNPFAFGAYECDTHDHTPSIYEDGYVESLLALCRKHGVSLLIPGLDDEVLLLARHAAEFEAVGTAVLCASEALVALCRDKERLCTELAEIADEFVKSYDRGSIGEALRNGEAAFPLISKPRGGFASRGIHILRNEADLGGVADGDIIQELAVPHASDPNRAYFDTQIAKGVNPQVSEVSIQLVYGRDQRLIGRMISMNRLHNGVPIEVMPFYDAAVWRTVDRIVPDLLRRGLVGPLNIQARLTDRGLKIFEMNPRFTGITGLRALLGFNEVEACAKDWLGMAGEDHRISVNPDKFGVRQTLDKSLRTDREPRVADVSRAFGFYTDRPVRRVLITGASGYLGRNLIAALRDDDRYLLTACGRQLSGVMEALPAQPNLTYCETADIASGRFPLGSVDVLLHMGSARPHHTTAELARSSRHSMDLLTHAAMSHVPSIIHLSSQSVYGSRTPAWWTEDTPVDPMIPYAISKYAVESHMDGLRRIYPHLRLLSIRLGSVAGGAPGMLDVDVITKLTGRALQGLPLLLTHPGQLIQRTDIRDAVDGIRTVLEQIDRIDEPVLNMGSPERMPLADLAELVTRQVALQTYAEPVPVQRSDTSQPVSEVGLASGRLADLTGWEARVPLAATVETVVRHVSRTRTMVAG